MSVITWIGLGNMGLPMATLLVQAGHDVRGVEINPSVIIAAEAAGIAVYPSAAQAAAGADAVVTMLPTGDHVREMLLGSGGLFAHAAEHTVFIDSSTIGVECARELHAAAAAVGKRFVDAPVSGGVVRAALGTLVFMIGGSDDEFRAASRFVEPLSSRIVHTGAGGTGQAAKVVNNLILAVCLAGTSEGLLLAERLGLDAGVFYDIAVNSTAENFALRDWCPAPGVVATAASSHGYAPGFSATLLLKDLTLALQEGCNTHTALDTARTVHALFAAVVDGGGGQYDCTALLPALRAGRDSALSTANKR